MCTVMCVLCVFHIQSTKKKKNQYQNNTKKKNRKKNNAKNQPIQPTEPDT